GKQKTPNLRNRCLPRVTSSYSNRDSSSYFAQKAQLLSLQSKSLKSKYNSEKQNQKKESLLLIASLISGNHHSFPNVSLPPPLLLSLPFSFSLSHRAKMSPATKEQPQRYPAPLASHEDVVNNANLFLKTLEEFHFKMGTKFMVPVIGGKELDLHVLYVEATKRGGYEKVVAEKKWREVGIVFQFSPTTTSASFVLRKHYLNLLYHYEQVHLFRIQGPIFYPTAAFPVNGSSSSRSELSVMEYSSAPPKPATKLPDLPSKGAGAGGSTFTATGTIEAKFECGYIVSVTVDSEVLSGVLYHPGQQPQIPPTQSTTRATNLVTYTPKRSRHYGGGRDGRGRGRGKRRGDPNYPKPNRSGYNFFFAEKHYKLKSLYPNREREFTRMIGHSWTNLSAEERSVYQNRGVQDKERYKRELKEYKEKLMGLEIGESS
ncbi:High mobility group B protein 9, partial [Linum perenne]